MEENIAMTHDGATYVAIDIDQEIILKNDVVSMEHPIFSLSKNPIFHREDYYHNDIKISFEAGKSGLPTHSDKDILIYLASLIYSEKEKGKKANRTLCISIVDLLKFTGRGTCGKSYTLLKQSLKRLKGSSITVTKEKFSGYYEEHHTFSFIDSYSFVETKKGEKKGKIKGLKISISDWLYQAVISNRTLTINSSYFNIKKSFEKRLYELCRKHCGHQKKFEIRLEKLHKKSGSLGSINDFRKKLRLTIKDDSIPDYKLCIDNDIVTIKPKKMSPILPMSEPELKESTLITAKKIIDDSGTRIDIKSALNVFLEYSKKKGQPNSIDGAFIGFIKNITMK